MLAIPPTMTTPSSMNHKPGQTPPDSVSTGVVVVGAVVVGAVGVGAVVVGAVVVGAVVVGAAVVGVVAPPTINVSKSMPLISIS